MSGSPRELAQQDRWRIVGRWLQERRVAAELTQQELADRLDGSVTARRLHVLETGIGEPTEAELDELVETLGETRSVLQAHVQDELLSLLMGTTAVVPELPTIVIVPPTGPQGAPTDRVLALVRLYQEPSAASSEVTLSGRAVESLAQRCGLSALECWQLLARYIPGDDADRR